MPANNVIPLRRKPVRLMECYRARMFRETTERLRAEVAAKEMRASDKPVYVELEDALLDEAIARINLAADELRRLTETW